ncbi:hypothetical protein FTW19_07320 [Terriglobus albidus]|uniref:Transglycosylase SLT domain-containing protein n=1 Tax=Terriglobus albidus TaxID=1592106 RepID=A0A5B9E6C1_9BACT|nr:hypothetical protein [Terriglobus albidus]QEE27822.1 hypothetical protein FTW19_07320 [Terriglobus albidus]
MTQMANPTAPTGIKVALSLDPPGPTFYIGRNACMPQIRATATVTGADAVALQGATYNWVVTLVMQNKKVPLSMGRSVAHPPINRTGGPTLVLPFTKVRGGQLTVTVTVRAPGLVSPTTPALPPSALTASRSDLQILGTNPTENDLIAEGASDLMIKIIRHESSTRQFLEAGSTAPGYPLFSQDHKGGVGLTQLTRPAPSDDEIWDWKANLRGGIAVLAKKTRYARNYLIGYASSSEFTELVKAYNEARARVVIPKPGMPPASPATPPLPLAVTLPAPTSDQIDRETLRAYNGYGRGLTDPDSKTVYYLPEYVAKIGTDGLLEVAVGADGRTGAAHWHENTAADREKFWRDKKLIEPNSKGQYIYPGDPDYVANVLKVAITDPPAPRVQSISGALLSTPER